jgi:16S rRNA (cytosine967-C5)-methyltransferase
LDRYMRALIEFSSRVLYEATTRHISHDRAFQSVLRRNRKLARLLPLRVLYRVSHDIISDYYTIRYLEARIYGRRGGAKRMAKLWLLYRGLESPYLQAYLENVERLRRKLLRSLPRAPSSIEELLDEIEDEAERLAVKHSYPRWFAATFLRLLGPEEADRLLAALNEEKWWIRVNTLKADVDTVAERLLEKGVVVRRDPDLDYMLEVVEYGEPLHHLEEMWRGEIVFQDKASAMVVEALEPQPGDRILDMAAAPGVKDTLVQQLTGNRATIYAADASWERLKRTRRVLDLYSASRSLVDLIHADSSHLAVSRPPDKIILDAPCTSSGAIGKDPAIKLHLEDPDWVQRFPRIQEALLENAARLAGPETVIVYATCSLLPFEGEEQVERQLGRLEPEEPPIPGAKGYPGYRVSPKVRRFLPHLHGTQGFFIARLQSRRV